MKKLPNTKKHSLSVFNLNYTLKVSSLFFIFCFSFFSEIFSQEESFLNLEQAIDSKDYNKSLSIIEGLENQQSFISNLENKLELDLKKHKVLLELSRFEDAIAVLLENLNNLDQEQLSKYYTVYSMNLGYLYLNKSKNLNRAKYYYSKAYNAPSRYKDSLNEIKINNQLGLIYYNEEKYDSAKFYYKKNIIFDFKKENQNEIAKAYANLGILEGDAKNYNLAKKYAFDYYNLVKKLKDSSAVGAALNNIGVVMHREGELDTAYVYYKKAYDIFSVRKGLTSRKATADILSNFAFIHEEKSNYKEAYLNLTKSKVLGDSISDSKGDARILELEARLRDSMNKEKVEAGLKQAGEKTQNAQILFYSAAFTLITLLVLGYIFYRNYKLKQENRLEHIENETQTKIITATIDAKEKERKSIAEILHDSVSALLSSANLHLQATKAQLKDNAPQEITKAQTILNEASVKIRDLSHNLISSVLLKFGLAFAIHDICQKYSNSEITLHSDDDGVRRYDQDFEIKLHSIIEELINNILKHSKASNATIMLSHRENDMLSVRISDDGIGFNPKNVKGKDGLGLSHIEARIKVMKGVFNIVSSKGNGTNIFILVPIKLKAVGV